MSTTSKIEWTEKTWNPTVGCSRVSPGCDNCYAERQARRHDHPGSPYEGTTVNDEQGVRWTGRVNLLRERLDEPLRWHEPCRIFVDSMSDIFHPEVLADAGCPPFLARVFATMAEADRHTFQVLTKRPQVMRAVLAEPRFRLDVNSELMRRCVPVMSGGFDSLWPENQWFGVSAENQRYADLRIPHLLESLAAVRFVSAEPLLGPINLRPRPPDEQHLCIVCGEGPKAPHAHRGGYRKLGLDWVIIGGESGPGARPMRVEWAESIVEQCRSAGVAVFVKQLGSVLGGKEHHEIETFPEALRVREYPG